jgi:HK97 family phage major capsid protein
MSVYTDISNEMMDDSVFDMRSQISSDVSEDFAKLEGAAFINGDGVNKPEGLLTNSDVGEYASGSASAITADSLFGIQGEVKEGYDMEWMFNRRTLHQHIRTLKDGNGDYLLSMGLGDLPNTVAGAPYVIANDMPDVSAGTYPILIGDYSKAYYIVDNRSLTTLEDPYTQGVEGMRRFIFQKRTGGQVVLAEAIKKLKIATSV